MSPLPYSFVLSTNFSHRFQKWTEAIRRAHMKCLIHTLASLYEALPCSIESLNLYQLTQTTFSVCFSATIQAIVMFTVSKVLATDLCVDRVSSSDCSLVQLPSPTYSVLDLSDYCSPLPEFLPITKRKSKKKTKSRILACTTVAHKMQQAFTIVRKFGRSILMVNISDLAHQGRVSLVMTRHFQVFLIAIRCERSFTHWRRNHPYYTGASAGIIVNLLLHVIMQVNGLVLCGNHSKEIIMTEGYHVPITEL